MPQHDEPIEGIKLIRLTGQVNDADDPTYPFLLEANLRPPEFMSFTFVALHGGSEEFAERGMTFEALHTFMERNKIKNHPRLRRYVITGPNGEVERVDRTTQPTTCACGVGHLSGAVSVSPGPRRPPTPRLAAKENRPDAIGPVQENVRSKKSPNHR